MRKLILTLTLVLGFASGAVFAQNCSPNPIFTVLGIPGVYPNPTTTTDLPDATVGVPYSYTFTVIVVGDTTIDLGAILPIPAPTVTVDVADQRITNIAGLPAGLSFACEPSSCSIPGDSFGCVIITGTPTAAGDFTADMETDLGIVLPNDGSIPAPFGGTTQYLPIPGLSYNLKVVDNSVGIKDAVNDLFGNVRNVPNPFQGSTEVKFDLLRPAKVDFAITDLTGKVLRSQHHNGGIGTNSILVDANDFAPGIYFYTLSDGKSVVTRKMVVTQ